MSQLIQIPESLLKESLFLLGEFSPDCPDWKRGVGDCNAEFCLSCRARRCSEALQEIVSELAATNAPCPSCGSHGSLLMKVECHGGCGKVMCTSCCAPVINSLIPEPEDLGGGLYWSYYCNACLEKMRPFVERASDAYRRQYLEVAAARGESMPITGRHGLVETLKGYERSPMEVFPTS